MPRQSRRAVLVLVDGARIDVLRALLDRGDLPHMARWVIEPGGLTVGTTVFPSTTGVAYIPFLFGCYPGTVGVPGTRWLDRAEAGGGWRDQWRAARSYCGIQGSWLDRDIAPRPSIFELVPDSLAICTPITRGLRPGAARIAVRRALLGAAAHYWGTYEALDRAVADAWVAAAAESWRFLFVVFPGPDGLTHLSGPDHPRVLESYRAVDRALGAFVARVRRHGEVPVFFVVSDHGASAMPEHCDLALALEGWGVPVLRHPFGVWRRGAQAAVMVAGNASAQVYFEPRTGRAAPRVERELPTGLVHRLLALPAVRLAAWRDGRGGMVVAAGEARARVVADGDEVCYEPLAGDPLELGPELLCLRDRDLLARTRATGLPDAPRQLVQLLGSPRAGDLVLAAGLGSDFRGPWEIPEHRAGHGSLIADHMKVPIAASVPLPEAPLRTVDVMPAILDTLEVPLPETLDGVPLRALAAAPGVR